jgi:FkbM family methyltransferase
VNVQETLHKIVSALEDRRSLGALLTWPKFSLESFLVVSRLAKQGVLPKTVIDVGANAGQFATAAAKLWPDARIYSFEPDPAVAEVLKKNARNLNQITVFPHALGDSVGAIDFHVNTLNQASSILKQSKVRREIFPEQTVSGIIKIEIQTLDSAVSKLQLESPVLLKIDTQGYEDRVLRGARETLKSVDFVLLEASMNSLYDGELTFTEMVKLMDELGFSFLRPLSWHLAPRTGEIIEMDILFSNRKNRR